MMRMMKKQTHLDIWAKEIVKKTGFVLEKEIYRGYYYSQDYVRNLILSGLYKGKPAVLKIYDDPRLCEEPNALAFFNKLPQAWLFLCKDIEIIT